MAPTLAVWDAASLFNYHAHRCPSCGFAVGFSGSNFRYKDLCQTGRKLMAQWEEVYYLTVW